MHTSSLPVSRRRLVALLSSALLAGSLLPGIAGVAIAFAPNTALVIGPLAPKSATAGEAIIVPVFASIDGGATIASDVSTGISFASSDPRASLVPVTTGLLGGAGEFTVVLRTPGTQTIVFSSADGLPPAVATVTVSTGPATKLLFGTAPVSGASASAFGVAPVVRIVDAGDNTVDDDSTGISLTLLQPADASAGSGVLSGCTAPVTASDGTATFLGCKITGGGKGFTMLAQDSGSLLGSVVSGAFDVSASAAFETQPGGTKIVAGTAFPTQPKVTLRWKGTPTNFTTDKSAADSTTKVTLAIKAGTGTAGAVLACDPSTNTAVVAAGSATFAGCRIDKPGTGYVLTATTDPALTPVESTPLDVVPGAATKLIFATQPVGANAGVDFATQPVVAIADAAGNIVTSGVSANIVLSIATSSATPTPALTCTPSNTVATATSGATAGKAVFAGCDISSGGSYTLSATATNLACSTGACAGATLASATSGTFVIGASTGGTITLTAASRSIVWGQKIALRATISPAKAGRKVRLEMSTNGKDWKRSDTRTTASDGTAAWSFPPSVSRSYRVVFDGDADLSTATSAVLKVGVRSKVTVTPRYTTIRAVKAGQSLTFTALVRPLLTDQKFTVRWIILRQISGTWAEVGTRDTVTNPADNNRASLSYKFGAKGRYAIRAWVLTSASNQNSYASTRQYFLSY